MTGELLCEVLVMGDSGTTAAVTDLHPEFPWQVSAEQIKGCFERKSRELGQTKVARREIVILRDRLWSHL